MTAEAYPASNNRRQRLERVAFRTSRLAEFCGIKELTAQFGQEPRSWPTIILKELLDNALDGCEELGIAPEINVEVSTAIGQITITDNGPGIPPETLAGVLDYTVRVSSREAYVSPTRGQQGNALKCIFAAAFALDGTRGVTLVETSGQAYRIVFEMDPVRREPRILPWEITPSDVQNGTRITVFWPGSACHLLVDTEDQFVQIAQSFTTFNPHLSLRGRWNDHEFVNVPATNPGWHKWLGDHPTSSHWYNAQTFSRYIAALIADDQDHSRVGRTVRHFIAELDGLSRTAKQKIVLAETATSAVTLATFFESGQPAVARLLSVCQANTKPISPDRLGLIGADHLREDCSKWGADEESFRYRRHLGVTRTGLPYALEAAFAYRSQEGEDRKLITGVNFSVGIGSPFERLRLWQSLTGLLGAQHVDSDDPVLVVLHYTCPEVQFLDRGKGVLHLPPDVAIELTGLVKAVTKSWDKQKRDEIRSNAAFAKRRERLLKAQTQSEKPAPAEPIGVLFEKITDAASKAGMSVSSLIVLSEANDPYTSWKRRADAEVFARLFNRLVAAGEKKHLRGLFYRCIMLPETVLWPTGKPLVNTYGNWVKFQKASSAARWLGLVPFSQIVDARNDEAEIYVPEHDQARTGITGGDAVDLPADIAAALPRFYLEGFQGQQTHRIIFYGEKTSLAEVLRPVARAIGAEMVLATGESSGTRLAEALERASKDGRPTVLLYFADFDPSGHQMSISVARKVQAHIDFQYPTLNIKLYRVALTIDQVRGWGLPDKPIPPKEKRAGPWREAFGAEQTEIDAAIELAPEQLRAAIFDAVRPFYDDTLDQRVEHAAEVWQQTADDLLRGHLDYDACRQRIEDAFERLQIAAAELTDEQERAGEILKQTVPEPPECPKVEPSGTAKAPLFDSKSDFVTASLRLIADKRLSPPEPDDDEEDVE